MSLKSAQNQSLSNEITREALTKSAVLYQSFFNRNWPRKFPQNSHEIGRFFPAKFDIFFHDLPEALIIEAGGMLALILSALIINVRLKEAVLLLYQQQDFGIMCL